MQDTGLGSENAAMNKIALSWNLQFSLGDRQWAYKKDNFM